MTLSQMALTVDGANANVTLRNLHFLGGGVASTCVRVAAAQRVHLDHSVLQGCQFTGLTIASGGRVDVLVSGSVDDVRAAVEAGRRGAEKAGELNGWTVISRPSPTVMACFGAPTSGTREAVGAGQAMGLLETRSTVALAKGLDAMLKAADVAYEGSCKVGYFLTASVIRGDVGAVRTALYAGSDEAEKHGEIVSAHLIPQPYAEMESRLMHQ